MTSLWHLGWKIVVEGCGVKNRCSRFELDVWTIMSGNHWGMGKLAVPPNFETYQPVMCLELWPVSFSSQKKVKCSQMILTIVHWLWHTIWNTAHVYWSYCICSVQWMCLLLLGVYEFIFPSICSVSCIFSVLQSHMFEFVCLHCTQFHHEFPELLYVLLFPGANFTEHLKTRSSVWRHGRFAVLMTDPNQDTCRRCEKECCVRSIGDKWARKC